jgi:hypothetical protein
MSQDQLIEQYYFQTPVYLVKKPEFLPVVNAVSQRYIERSRARKKNKNPVMVMSGSYMNEPEIAEFAKYVSQTGWNILSAQGYRMEDLVTYFTEMWTQEHNHMSSMETHVHGHGVQISAFYFLDAPENSCKLVVHDPRPGKVIVNLHQKDARQVTEASHQIVFKPEPGLLVFINSWVPHSFTKNFSKQPLRFVHINMSVALSPEALERIKNGEVPKKVCKMKNKKSVEVL